MRMRTKHSWNVLLHAVVLPHSCFSQLCGYALMSSAHTALFANMPRWQALAWCFSSLFRYICTCGKYLFSFSYRYFQLSNTYVTHCLIICDIFVWNLVDHVVHHHYFSSTVGLVVIYRVILYKPTLRTKVKIYPMDQVNHSTYHMKYTQSCNIWRANAHFMCI